MAFVRKKSKAGGSKYHQLVESRRVDGRPRQKVLVHLGAHATVDDALKRWPTEIKRLRRSAYEAEANALTDKLARLTALRADGKV